MTRNLTGISAPDAPAFDWEGVVRQSTGGCPDCQGEGTVEVQDGIIQHGPGYYDCSPDYRTIRCDTCSGRGWIEVERCNRCHLITDPLGRIHENIPDHLACDCSRDEFIEWAANSRPGGHQVWLQVQAGRTLIQRSAEMPKARRASILREVAHDLHNAITTGDREIAVLLPGMLYGAAELTSAIQEKELNL